MFFRCHFLNAKSPCRSHFCERQRLFAVRIQLGLGRWNNTLLLLGQCPPSRFLTAPGCCSGTLPLYSGTHHFSLSAISGFLFVIAPTIHKPARYRNSSSYFYGSLHFYRKTKDSSSIPKSHSADIPFR